MTKRLNLPIVHAVIVSFNGERWIKSCIDSLRNCEISINITVVDNSSVDRTTEIVLAEEGVKLIQMNSNVGFGIANNIGISAALKCGADFIFLINQDCWISAGAIEALLSQASISGNEGILSGVQVDEKGEIDTIQLRGYLARLAPTYLSDLRRRKIADRYIVPEIGFAACLISRNFFETVGGFDPLFFMYAEDSDLCQRGTYHGFSIWFVPGAEFVHVRGFHPGYRELRGFAKIRRDVSLARSELIFRSKSVNGKLIPNIVRAVSSQFFGCFDTSIQTFSISPILTSFLSVIFLIRDLPKIIQHRSICRKRGPHWIAHQ